MAKDNKSYLSSAYAFSKYIDGDAAPNQRIHEIASAERSAHGLTQRVDNLKSADAVLTRREEEDETPTQREMGFRKRPAILVKREAKANPATKQEEVKPKESLLSASRFRAMMDTDDESSKPKPPPGGTSRFRRRAMRNFDVDEPPKKKEFLFSDDEPPKITRRNYLTGDEPGPKRKVEITTSRTRSQQEFQNKQGDDDDGTSNAQYDKMARYRKMLDDDDGVAYTPSKSKTTAMSRRFQRRRGDEAPVEEYEPPNTREIGFRRKPETVTRSEVVVEYEYEPPSTRESGFRKSTETSKRFGLSFDDDEWEPPNRREIGFKRKIETTKSGNDLANNASAVRAGLIWSSDTKMDRTTEVSKGDEQTQSLSRRNRLGRMVEADAAAGTAEVDEAPGKREIGFRKRADVVGKSQDQEPLDEHSKDFLQNKMAVKAGLLFANLTGTNMNEASGDTGGGSLARSRRERLQNEMAYSDVSQRVDRLKSIEGNQRRRDLYDDDDAPTRRDIGLNRHIQSTTRSQSTTRLQGKDSYGGDDFQSTRAIKGKDSYGGDDFRSTRTITSVKTTREGGSRKEEDEDIPPALKEKMMKNKMFLRSIHMFAGDVAEPSDTRTMIDKRNEVRRLPRNEMTSNVATASSARDMKRALLEESQQVRGEYDTSRSGSTLMRARQQRQQGRLRQEGWTAEYDEDQVLSRRQQNKTQQNKMRRDGGMAEYDQDQLSGKERNKLRENAWAVRAGDWFANDVGLSPTKQNEFGYSDDSDTSPRRYRKNKMRGEGHDWMEEMTTREVVIWGARKGGESAAPAAARSRSLGVEDEYGRAPRYSTKTRTTMMEDDDDFGRPQRSSTRTKTTVYEVEDEYVRPPRYSTNKTTYELVEDDFSRPPRYSTKIKMYDEDLDGFGKKSSWMDDMTTDNFITYIHTPSPKRVHPVHQVVGGTELTGANRGIDGQANGTLKKNVGAKSDAGVEEESDDVEGMLHTAKEVKALKMNKMFMTAGEAFADDVGIHKMHEDEPVQEPAQEPVEEKSSKKDKKKKEVAEVVEQEEEPKAAKKEKKEKKAKA